MRDEAATGIQRRRGGLGSLIPTSRCPLWADRNQQKDGLTYADRTNDEETTTSPQTS